MTDDIVTRLREQADSGYIDEHDVMLRIAADEIERLRATIKEWRDIASDYYHIDSDCDCLLCERYRKATGLETKQDG